MIPQNLVLLVTATEHEELFVHSRHGTKRSMDEAHEHMRVILATRLFPTTLSPRFEALGGFHGRHRA